MTFRPLPTLTFSTKDSFIIRPKRRLAHATISIGTWQILYEAINSTISAYNIIIIVVRIQLTLLKLVTNNRLVLILPARYTDRSVGEYHQIGGTEGVVVLLSALFRGIL